MGGWIELCSILKEIGLAAGALGLCIYVVVQVVGKLSIGLDKNSAVLDKMIAKLELNMARVQKEHEDLIEDHKEFSVQNKEITACLGRINGYK